MAHFPSFPLASADSSVKDEKFSGDTQRMMKMAYDASGGSNNNVRTRWWDMRMTAENISLRIEDPVLEQDEE